MDIKNLVSCTRGDNRAEFSFVNLFGGHHYPVTMTFTPSGAVNIVVAGARYRCPASQVTRMIDESAPLYSGLADITYSIEAGEFSFYIPADVHEQLRQHPEFKKQDIIEWKYEET